ncbi:hypothetical protein PVAND_013910 [Polypedilum vanderplanki]|uniref:Peptidase S1 domain-containing protein n=1 Tax=Polypedilum vanderplanki TaxID=319348 RepID=A0A9J6CRY1_POLVA|nr:hypothetical protein PVAND_013910 [Polypedilum vanderplanki]
MIIRNRVCILLQILCCAFVNSQLVGEECIRDYDNARGICVSHRECKRAREEHALGIPLTYCSFLDGVTNICCPQFEKRKSASKCEEYGDLTKKKDCVWTSLIQNHEPQCFETFTCNPSTPLIYGGDIAKGGEFPHMVAIGWQKLNTISFDCGGSLISERYVLTAAHCEKSDNIRPSFVRLGDQNVKTRDDGMIEIDIAIEDFIVHQDYSSITHKNDIALIRMAQEVKFSESIRPACLWQTSSVNFTKLIACGWGALEYASQTSDELRKVELDVVNNTLCNQLLRESLALSNNKLIGDSQLCAGLLKGGKDTCQGDSGGPLHVSIRDGNPCQFHIVGITSYGSILCGTPNTPAVYTRVSAYLDWIESIVWR